MFGFGQLVFRRPQTFGPFTEIRKEKTKWMNLVLEEVESPGSQRTAVLLVSRGVTLLVCGFGQLVFVTSQKFVPFTETRNEKTKWMNLFLEKVESPGSQRTTVILGSRGVTLPDTLFRHVLDHLPINTPPLHPELIFFTARSDGTSESDSRFAIEERVGDFGKVGGSGHGGP